MVGWQWQGCALSRHKNQHRAAGTGCSPWKEGEMRHPRLACAAWSWVSGDKWSLSHPEVLALAPLEGNQRFSQAAQMMLGGKKKGFIWWEIKSVEEAVENDSLGFISLSSELLRLCLNLWPISFLFSAKCSDLSWNELNLSDCQGFGHGAWQETLSAQELITVQDLQKRRQKT